MSQNETITMTRAELKRLIEETVREILRKPETVAQEAQYAAIRIREEARARSIRDACRPLTWADQLEIARWSRA